MRAQQITGFGWTEKLAFREDLPAPTVGSKTGVLVRVHAAGVNPIDYKMLEGLLQLVQRWKLPFVPLFDFAGVVEEVGAAVTHVAAGDRVYGMAHFLSLGAAAELILTDAQYVAKTPSAISLQEAAALPLAAMTSLQGLRKGGGLREGARVLVIGASGGTGSMAVQLAAAHGATVYGVCSGKNADYVRGLGAAAVVDYTQEEWHQAVPAHSFDCVYDCKGNDGGRSYYLSIDHVLKKEPAKGDPTPAYVCIVGDSIGTLTVAKLTVRTVTRLGRNVSSWWKARPRYIDHTCASNRADLEILAKLVDEGKLTVTVSHSFPLRELGDAFEQMRSMHTRGKIVIDVVDG